MARSTYFAFHYQNDIWRVNVVRNSHVVQGVEEAGFIDSSLWEEAKRKGDASIKRMIDSALVGTTVTVFLLGLETANRPYVKYELEKSWSRGNGLIAVYLDQIEDQWGLKGSRGSNILNSYHTTIGNTQYNLSNWFKAYDWIQNDGYKNFGNWVEEAYNTAQSLKLQGLMPS